MSVGFLSASVSVRVREEGRGNGCDDRRDPVRQDRHAHSRRSHRRRGRHLRREHVSMREAVSSPERGGGGASHSHSRLERALQAWGLDLQLKGEFSRARIIHEDPPIVAIPNFIGKTRCNALMRYGASCREELQGEAESDLYLNYRVNQEVYQSGRSAEAAALIEEQEVSEAKLKAGQKSGFRTQVVPALVRPILPELLRFMGLPDRNVEFEEGLWYKPNRTTMYVRDQTVVHYVQDEGVAPHVDGKDATLLVYLNDVPEGHGGCTVFPDIGLSVPPRQGTALLYPSKRGLLHYSEAVKEGEKWIMQLLIDFKYDPNLPQIDWKTGRML